MNGEFWRPEAVYRKQQIDIMAKIVADLLVDVLADTGVRRIYGVSGDSLNGMTDSIRVRRDIQWVHLRDRAKTTSQLRVDSVVPLRQRVMALQAK
jgi:hypothetical protein